MPFPRGNSEQGSPHRSLEAAAEGDPINPMWGFAGLSPQLPDNEIVTADSGSVANWCARPLKFRGAMRGSVLNLKWISLISGGWTIGGCCGGSGGWLVWRLGG